MNGGEFILAGLVVGALVGLITGGNMASAKWSHVGDGYVTKVREGKGFLARCLTMLIAIGIGAAVGGVIGAIVGASVG